MKILYFGGQKSGKSLLAESKTLAISRKKPYYIATYDNSYNDSEMSSRVSKHQKQREDRFITIEETINIPKVIKDGESYLIDCISMWILNNLDNEEELFAQLDDIAKIEANMVFVLNDVNSGIIPMDEQSRKFVDMTGVVGQRLANICNEVYEVKLGLEIRVK